MLTHIVCWKYKAETTEAERRAHVERLRSLSELVPGIKSFEVGSDVLGLERSYDTGLVAVYEGRVALDAYTVHPEHQKVAAMGKEIAEHVVSVDFVTEDQ